MSTAEYPGQASAVADATGSATATISNGGLTPWRLVRMTVNAAEQSNLTISPARVYRNAVVPSNVLGGTRTGQLDTDPDPHATIAAGESVICQWSGLTPGVVGTFSILYRFDT